MSRVDMDNLSDNIELSMEQADDAWRELSEKLEAFIGAWEESGCPRVTEFVPTSPPALRKLVLVELIKVDLEYRWAQGSGQFLESYAGEFPELRDPQGRFPVDLIYEEYHVRKQAGEFVVSAAYFDRFPQQQTELAGLLELQQPGRSTALYSTSLRSAARNSDATQRTDGPPPEPIEVGSKIDDFDLLNELGSGAFATVYLARQRSMQRLVALKISTDSSTEPQTLAQLDHPNIVRVFDQRQLEDRQLRLLYMQYVSGGTLEAVVENVRQLGPRAKGQPLLQAVDAALERRGENPPAESSLRYRLQHSKWSEVVCWIGVRLAEALEYAHRRGVLHRDIKPANVLLTGEGNPKLADFNISFSSQVEGATPTAFFGGSVAYMSPEQLEAYHPGLPKEPDDLDRRIDVYSLAVVLWELLAGCRPFRDVFLPDGWEATIEDMLARRQKGVPPESRAMLPADSPPGLEELLLECLAPAADDRIPTAEQMAKRLTLCLQPRAHQLMRPPKHSWRRKVLGLRGLGLLMLGGLVPNIALSLLNIGYNANQILGHMSEKVLDTFFSVQVGVVNAIWYTVGIGVLLSFAMPLIVASRKAGRGDPPSADEWPALSRRTLWLGQVAAIVSFALWIASGVIFPLWIDAASENNFALTQMGHFMISQILCGAIASTLTFFLITFVSMRYLYPQMVPLEINHREDILNLKQLDQRVGIFFWLAVSVPFLAVLALVSIEMLNPALAPDVPAAEASKAVASELVSANERQHDLMKVFAVLAMLGLVGAGAAFRLARSIRGDAQAMITALGATSGTTLSGEEQFSTESLSSSH